MIMETSLGKIEGLDQGDYWEFRGIRYAIAKRWHAPTLVDSWEGVYDATVWKNKSWQFDWTPQEFYGKEFYDDDSYDVEKSEDCLFLNLYVPKNRKSSCPTAIWYHGGGMINGWSNEKEFDGAGYAKRGVILVTVNYRLGLFGYFCHPELTKRDKRCGNYGLLDQIAALDWVNRHIGEFGGDPKKITIFGQSAGSISVQAMICSPLTRGKMSGAIMQSGNGFGTGRVFMHSMEKMEQHGKLYFEKLGLQFEDLESMSAKELFSYTEGYMNYMTAQGVGYAPVIDGYVLTQTCEETVSSDQLPSISYMIGCTRDDCGKSNAPDEKIIRHSLFYGAQKWCEALVQQGRNVYFYYFNREMPGDENGAFHASDLWYVFGTTKRCWRGLTAKDAALSEKMMDCWSHFFKDGTPDTSNSWKAYDMESEYVKVFDVED